MMQRTIIDPKIRNLIDLSQAGAAALQAKYGGEMRTELIRIAPEYLETDELEYELLLRGLVADFIDDRSRTRALRAKLVEEHRGARVPFISPTEFSKDVGILKEKITDVAQRLQTEGLEGHTYNSVVTRLAHLEQRVGRLKADDEPTRAVKEDLGNQVEYMIRSLIDYTRGKGARPKNKNGIESLPELGRQCAGSGRLPGGQSLIELDILSYQNAEQNAQQSEVPVTHPGMPSEGPTFNDILGMMGARPEAQSSSWSNRDSLGTAVSGNSRNVQFSLEATRPGEAQNVIRRDTPYPGRGIQANLQMGVPNGPHQTSIGSPSDYMAMTGPEATDIHGRLTRGVLNDHAAMGRNGFNNAREAINRNASRGTRTYDVEGAFTCDTRRQNENINQFGQGRHNSLGQFGQTANYTGQPGSYGRTDPINQDVFGILGPNQNTAMTTGELQWGRNASEFGQFARTKAVPVHTWKVSFGGENKKMSDTDVGANDFIYRVNVNKRMQGLSDADILSQIGFLLTHSASTWYLACQHMFTSWQTFVDAMRRTFLSSYHMIDAMDEISRRTQGKSESARSYLYHMVMLFKSLPYGVAEHVQTHIIIRNLLPEIQANVGPWGPTTIAELERILASMQPRNFQPVTVESRPPMRRVFTRKVNAIEETAEEKEESVFEVTEEELCAIKREREVKKNRRVVVTNRSPGAVEDNSAKTGTEGRLRPEDMKCFNCKEMGHSFRKCPKDRVGKFCFRCGSPDVTTNECIDCPKNRVSCLDSEAENQTEQLQNEQ